MITTSEYALMAGASYISTRDAKNRFPAPLGWTVVTNPPHFNDDSSGFEAVSFKKGTEIVISFAGTYDKSFADSHGNQNRQTGSYTKTDNSTGQADDLWFLTNPSSTRQDTPLDVAADIRELPNIAGTDRDGGEFDFFQWRKAA